MAFDISAASHTITEQEFARLCGVSFSLIRELRRQGKLKPIRLNSRILYLRDDVRVFLEQNRDAAAEVAA